ncbi:unnamed protein product [Blepharisma stoltei]|uniref:RING-type domain-containing protein n=1 Tax=Blepharisma stoltei TaxID=1481888 RepID=A0AAU9JXU1_9CILI|nr:unnamed protein product [Blepharisma stoltei]
MNSGCPCTDHLLGNGNCEAYCNVLACNWDKGDCNESKDPADITMILIIVLVPTFILILAIFICIVRCFLKRKSNSHRHEISIAQEGDDFISKLSFEKLASFPAYTGNLSSESVLICAICLAELQKDENIIITKCLHEYHEECMNQWINSSKNKICPCCRKKV